MGRKVKMSLVCLLLLCFCCGCGAAEGALTEDEAVAIAEDFRDAITGLDFTAAKEMYTAEKQQTVEESYMEAGWVRTVANYGDYLDCASVSVRAEEGYTVVAMALNFSGGETLTMEVYLNPAGEVDGFAYLVA